MEKKDTLSNAQIITEGLDSDTTDKSNNYGIYLDECGKSGTIKIHLKNKSSITTKSNTNQNFTGYGMIIENFKGKIEIIIDSGSSIVLLMDMQSVSIVLKQLQLLRIMDRRKALFKIIQKK